MNQFFNTITGGNGEACVLLYGNIGSYDGDTRSGDIVRELIDLESKYNQIDFRINSMGGEVYHGIAIFNALRQSKANIAIYIDGVAASMASVIASARRPVYMSRYARLMIHSVSGGAYGNKDELIETANELASLEDTLSDIYAERAGLTKEEIKSLFFDGKDHWLTAEEALRMKLIDDIYDTEPVPSGLQAAEVYAIYQNRLNPNSNMLLDLLRKKPSFAALADENAVLEHIAHLETEAGRVPSLATQITDLSARIKVFEDAEKETLKTRITGLLDNAVADGRIKEPQRATYAALLKKDFENTKMILEALPAARRVTGDLGNSSRNTQENSPWEARMEEIRNNLK
jgi:ATP-dependent Clp endopeptidase proteolytic subunit ClpP